MLEHMHASKSAGQPAEKEAILGYMAPYYDLVMGLMTLGGEKALRRREVELALIKPGDAVLEIGCGTGSLTLAARAQAGPGGRVCGIDAAPEMIEAARRKAVKAAAEIDFQVGLIQKIPYPDGSFDEILCSFMIFHMSEGVRRKGFAEIRRVLKVGGRLLVVDLGMPAQPWKQTLAKKFLGAMLQHDPKELLPLMQENGFGEIESGPSGMAMITFVRGRMGSG
jgi:ubiquinone/menaquinone biosynthesis C-methylase UbiE